MKTNHFEKTIKKYLDERALTDELFAERYPNEKKSIKDCCTYIVNEVKKSRRSGYAAEEIFGMAAHYYDEDDIKPGKPISGVRIVVDHVPELTAEEKEQAKSDAIEKYQQEVRAELMEKRKRAAEKRRKEDIEQPSLFG